MPCWDAAEDDDSTCCINMELLLCAYIYMAMRIFVVYNEASLDIPCALSFIHFISCIMLCPIVITGSTWVLHCCKHRRRLGHWRTGQRVSDENLFTPPKFDFLGGTRCLLELKVGSMYVRQHSTVYVVIISQTRTHPCSSAQIHHWNRWNACNVLFKKFSRVEKMPIAT